jgi:hypoxanthine phosphoribosyltransferase
MPSSETDPATPLEQAQADLTRGVGRTLLTAEEIQARIREMAADISRDYAGLNPLLVGVLKGVVFFMSDLLRAITIPVSVDFMAISRYDPVRKTRGAVRLIKDLEESVEGRHLIFVEDIVDTGLTLNYLLRILRARGPATLEVCTLFSKAEHRLVNVPIRYVGFELPDRFVVGFGLDYKEAYRHLPYVAELRPEVFQAGNHLSTNQDREAAP